MKVFRKIRQELLEENNMSRYMLYAIGEIILVVIGILIAFSIDNWSSEANERKQEVLILKQLEKEFQSNLVEIEEKITIRNIIMRSSEALISYIDNGIENVPLDTISYRLGLVQIEPTFDPATGVTMELINSGKLYLITNEELKSLLTTWSSEIAKLNETEQLMTINVNNRFQPYLDATYKKRHYWTTNTNIRFIHTYAKGESRSFLVTGELKKEMFEKILNDQVVENFLIRTGRHAFIANKESEQIRRRIITTLNIIAKQLSSGTDEH